ncbi:hypothetical protein DFP72DRAFT_1163472 [Ephemerocybe angulata]|uniref:Centrosomin N-terminal motif 1 domain-containing protein n=1 Tax=Ephemerocybe angulata TaxID=980116 RepID=A0A8H6II13_9AGAR|nr:hypothetical protein DFP72DRAFT_1163472 [Tulosesus angulatus]
MPALTVSGRMAAAPNSHDPTSPGEEPSFSSSLSHPDFSLGSFASGISTPHRSNLNVTAGYLRPPRLSGRAGSSSTLVPGSASQLGKASVTGKDVEEYAGLLHDDEVTAEEAAMGDSIGPGSVLDTPGPKPKGVRTRSGTVTAAAAPSKVSKLTLRDQEKHIDNLKKENFSIKLRVHFLEDQLARMAPDQMDAALKQNINLKIEVQQRGMEIKKLKKLVLSLEHELERVQRGAAASAGASEREKELEQRRSGRTGDDALREAEARNAELEDELDNVKGLLEDNMDEIDRLKNIVQQRGSDKAEELENENYELREKLRAQDDLVSQLQDDRDDLQDALTELQLRLEELESRRHAESIERSQSRAALLDEQEAHEELEDEVNQLRDRVAALMIELQGKEDERVVDVVEDEWRGEVEEARGQADELKDVLAERDGECEKLRMHVADLEHETDELHLKFEGALEQLEGELEERTREVEEREHEVEERVVEGERKEAELEAMRDQLDRLGEQVFELEDESERLKTELERAEEEKERSEAVGAALKEKNVALKTEIQDLADAYDQAQASISEHMARQEELATHIEALVAELEATRDQSERTAANLTSLTSKLESQSMSSKRAMEEKEREIGRLRDEVERKERLVKEREADLAQLQDAFGSVERERKELGESVAGERFSAQLECDRLRRDLERAEDDLARLRADLASKEGLLREKEAQLDRWSQDNRELKNELGEVKQAKINLGEKVDELKEREKERERETTTMRARVRELEERLGKEGRDVGRMEGMYRDQLTERNTLLLTIYQYLDKIVGVEKSLKKGAAAETKPFTNFSVFHDNLITRLKALSQLQLTFSQRTKDIETKFTDKLTEMRRQLDSRWKQIEKFEASVKTVGELKGQWRRKLNLKEGEADALRTQVSELTSQVASLRRAGNSASETSEVKSLTARAVNAERRLNNAQNQLVQAEERIAGMNEKIAGVEGKWEARVKEYESRMRAAEERVKRERQGGKERVGELETAVERLRKQLEEARKRGGVVEGLLETVAETGARGKERGSGGGSGRSSLSGGTR